MNAHSIHARYFRNLYSFRDLVLAGSLEGNLRIWSIKIKPATIQTHSEKSNLPTIDLVLERTLSLGRK